MALFSEFGRVWIFNQFSARFPRGVFSSKAIAESWIAEHRLSGTLTLYPLDEGVYDIFVKQGWFMAKRPEQMEPAFIGGFTQASQDHEHYEEGRRLGDIIASEG